MVQYKQTLLSWYHSGGKPPRGIPSHFNSIQSNSVQNKLLTTIDIMLMTTMTTPPAAREGRQPQSIIIPLLFFFVLGSYTTMRWGQMDLAKQSSSLRKNFGTMTVESRPHSNGNTKNNNKDSGYESLSKYSSESVWREAVPEEYEVEAEASIKEDEEEEDAGSQGEGGGEEDTLIVTTDPEPSCGRVCPHGYNNRILYLAMGGAGLGDRQYIISHLAQIAGYLCATLYMLPPWYHLGTQHNGGEPLSQNIRWSDFWDLHFHDKEHTAILNDLMLPPHLINDTNRYYGRFVTPSHVDLIVQDHHLLGINNDGNSTNLTLVTKKNRVARDFEDLDRFVSSSSSNSSNGQGQEATMERFIWILVDNFYAWYKNDMESALQDLAKKTAPSEVKNLPTLCDYQEVKVSKLILALTDTIWHKLKTDFPNVAAIGHLHLRRGDAKKVCDTEIPTIKKYLQCSLADTRNKIGQFLVLFSSDESDATYRRTICQMVESDGHLCLDLDALIKAELERLLNRDIINNYFTFEVGKQISHRAGFQLERRRTIICDDCNNVTEMLFPVS
eukprot:scaffold884_cov202-Amphora_coffeaeformis.AAC.1